MKKYFLLFLLLLFIPIVKGEDIITMDKFQTYIFTNTIDIKNHIDNKYNEWENYSNYAINDMKGYIDGKLDAHIRRVIIGILTSYIIGAVVVLLFVTWYLRRITLRGL